jgi:ABC-type multidrug transport system fused ATPase/permease subunit
MSMGFPMLLYTLVMEKEEGVTELMTINGLKIIYYWATYYIYYFIVLSCVSVFFVLLGYLIVDSPYFRETSIVIQILMLSIWNIAQISWALLLSTFIKTSRLANLVGYLSSIFLVLIIGSISQFLFPAPQELPWVFYLIPHSGMLRAFYAFASICSIDNCVQGFGDVTFELGEAMLMMLLFAILYGFLGLLLNEPTIRNKVRGCLKKKIELGSSRDSRIDSTEMVEEISESGIEYIKQVKELDPNDPNYVLIAKDLRKQYPAKKDKPALDQFYLSVERGTVFGLLGPNGAGKTTFLKILTGTEKSDTGEAYISGINVQDRSGDNIKVGFCPQFDILWPVLTVIEHLVFFSYFKDVPSHEIKEKTKTLIEKVNLDEDCNKLARELSGGMKRRVSLAIA